MAVAKTKKSTTNSSKKESTAAATTGTKASRSAKAKATTTTTKKASKATTTKTTTTKKTASTAKKTEKETPVAAEAKEEKTTKKPPKAGAANKKEKVTMHASHWQKSKKMDSDKFEKVSQAILQVLSTKAKKGEGMRWGVLSKEVEAIVTDFEGSVAWHAISAIRELETRGQVRRDQSGKTSLYYKI